MSKPIVNRVSQPNSKILKMKVMIKMKIEKLLSQIKKEESRVHSVQSQPWVPETVIIHPIAK